MTEYQILARDVSVLEKMAADMEAYLSSECTHWVLGNGGLPRLTLGGYLMRQHRLLVLCKTLCVEDQRRMSQAVELFNKARTEKVVRFEHRAHQELHARLSEWVGYLRSLKEYKAAHVASYDSVADTRVVIGAIVDKLREPPYQLDPKVLEEVDTLDKNLRNRWQPGDFVWHSVWQPAYPEEQYWWLYGQPK
jgi:hypothetical protein